MSHRPQITWNYFLAWVRDNKVPDAAILNDPGDRYVSAFSFGLGVSVDLLMKYSVRKPLTLGDLKEWAQQRGVEPKSSLTLVRGLSSPRPVTDLSHWEKQPDEDYLTLQEGWG